MFMRPMWTARPRFDAALFDPAPVRRELLRLLEGAAPEEAGPGVFPPINVSEDADNLYVTAEIPGVAADALRITALHNQLSLAGARTIAAEQEQASYHRRERAEGAFDRTITLPAMVDAQRITARCADGILTLTLPKAEASKPRQIKVQA